MTPPRRFISALIVAACCTAAHASAQEPAAMPPPGVSSVIYMPTPVEVVRAMLEMAHVGKDDIVYDLGSGDGRIVISAVRDFGAARGVGIEIDPLHVEEARANARRAEVADRVQFLVQDLFATNLSEATVVALYLLPSVNLQLRPKLLAELKPGTRIVSHAFDMGDWQPTETRTVSGRMVYLWTIPVDR
jgi:precorrin-6B methylase 2